MVEGLSRLALYLEFLRSNPEIKILVPEQGVQLKIEYLEALGIDASRVIIGYVTARVLYLPQGPGCKAGVPPLGMNMLSDYLLSYIHTYIRPARAPKDVILLIHRLFRRWLPQHKQIKEYLGNMAKANSMELLIFSDLRIPKLPETMKMFHRAAMVVAPHGAGLVNLLFTRNPTVVIEIVKDDNTSTFSYVNMCRNLGHVYHSIKSHRKDGEEKEAMFVEMETLEETVEFYLNNFVIPNKESGGF